MKVLIVGGGGREHALAWRIANNPKGEVHKIYCAPGNDGMRGLAEPVPIGATDIEALAAFAKENRIDYTIVGMDDPLERGIADRFLRDGLRVFGPVREAARLEWSKAFSKGFMKKYGIPTAGYEVFDDFTSASDYAVRAAYPLVIKADGLAVGKGVYVCETKADADKALRELMTDRMFGGSGDRVVVEEFINGPEITVMAFCDGKTIVPMVSSKDHKKAFDGDRGPNTGGMGAVSPAPAYTEAVAERFKERVMIPTIEGLIKEGLVYKGFLYFGLILKDGEPYVLEYNARFGDPEAQVILPRLKTDLLDICFACEDQSLDKMPIEWDNKESACVCLVSEGYPKSYATGFPISGLDLLPPETMVFCAGVKQGENGLETAGGRVLGVTCLGEGGSAVGKVYEAVGAVSFRNMRYRNDIGGQGNITN